MEETVALAAAARDCGAAAASAFGAGFGGGVWALVDAADAKAFMVRWRRDYAVRFPDRGEGRFFSSLPGPPAFELE